MKAHVCRENVTLEDGLPEKPNQDAYLVSFEVNGVPDQHLFAVCDGHGKAGDLCAQYVTASLEGALLASPHFEEEPPLAFHAAMRQINAEMARDPNIDDWKSGTTAVCALLRGSTLHIANVGDSRAILAISNGDMLEAVDLTDDQTPFRDDERDRVQQSGAVVMSLAELQGETGHLEPWEWTADDPPRCWAPHAGYPGCAFTRSIGDQNAKEIGVTPVPEMLIREVPHPPGSLTLTLT